MRHILLAVFLVVACAAAASIEEAKSAYDRGDYTQAAGLFAPLAEQGVAAAQFKLGVMYRYGEGVPKEVQEAVKWYRKAAEQGHAAAQFNLGVMYRHGQGVSQDYQEALKWYCKAAEQGHAAAQNNLGVMYEVGQGVPQDFARAHMWYSIGVKASSGDGQKVSMKNRNSVLSQMTAEQIGKAQEMERRCQETKFKECDCD